MQYMLLVYHQEQELVEMPEAELAQVVGDCIAFMGELEASGHHVASQGLQSVSTATTLRNVNGRTTMTDGPFAETKEVLGGFTIIEARDLNEALQLASKFPTTRLGSIEVRPVMDPTQEMSNSLDRKLASAVKTAMMANCG